jgi:FixJ family two-component response regulator
MARLASLTPQQVRVLMMLSEGLLNKQIAYELSVSGRPKGTVSAILRSSASGASGGDCRVEDRSGQWPQAGAGH